MKIIFGGVTWDAGDVWRGAFSGALVVVQQGNMVFVEADSTVSPVNRWEHIDGVADLVSPQHVDRELGVSALVSLSCRAALSASGTG